jgi:hypothetical protein
LDEDMFIAEQSSPALQRVGVELPGQLKRARLVQAAREVVGYRECHRMVFTEHSTTPGEAVLAELAGLATRAGFVKGANEDTGGL